jgi:hypothetical protein
VLHEDGAALLLLLPSSSQAQEGGEDSLAADLYDFGMVVLQLFTGLVTRDEGLTELEQSCALSLELSHLCRVVRLCTVQESHERPSAQQVCDSLETLEPTLRLEASNPTRNHFRSTQSLGSGLLPM